jgi:hypothetical protein
MAVPKKKLPTGPIKITSPFAADLDQEDVLIPESSQQDSLGQDTKSDDLKIAELLENKDLESSLQKQDSRKPESRKQDSGFADEYQKVSMRLSAVAVDQLRSLRVETGIPYEILVDVMIRSWQTLPERMKHRHLSEAKQQRGQRLVAGQDKAMKTVKRRLAIE